MAKKFKIISLYFLVIVFVAACGQQSSIEKSKEKQKKEKTVEIVYVKWDSEVASSNLLKAVIEEKLGYNAELLPVTLTALWESIAAGDQDVTVAAWLPSLQKTQKKQYQDQVEILGPNLEGTKIGLAVPSYVPLDSITELRKDAKKFEGKIIGIEPDAGIMRKTNQVLKEYDLAGEFELVSGSDKTMTTALENAIEDERWIVITGWTPHWKFEKWDLKYLKDPKDIYGSTEHISTVVRKGLKDDLPQVYNFLDNFYWQVEDMEECMMLMQQEDTTLQGAAKKWISQNEELVQEWIND